MDKLDDHASWVENNQQITLSEFQRRVVNLTCRAFGTGPHNIPVWHRVDWDFGLGVSFCVKCGRLATFDFDSLTRLVIGAHDEAIRIEIDGGGPRYVRLNFHPRQREGRRSARHPTIEAAVVGFRKETDAV